MIGEIGCRMRTSEIRGLLLGRQSRRDCAFGKEFFAGVLCCEVVGLGSVPLFSRVDVVRFLAMMEW